MQYQKPAKFAWRLTSCFGVQRKRTLSLRYSLGRRTPTRALANNILTLTEVLLAWQCTYISATRQIQCILPLNASQACVPAIRKTGLPHPVIVNLLLIGHVRTFALGRTSLRLGGKYDT